MRLAGVGVLLAAAVLPGCHATRHPVSRSGPLDPYQFCLAQGRLDCGPPPSAPTPSTTTVPTTACDPEAIGVSKAGFQNGLTGGGVAVSITLTTPADCFLTSEPGVMILDATGQVVTFGIAQTRPLAGEEGTPPTAALWRNKTNQIVGEWRGVCSPIQRPLRVRVQLENVLHTISAPGDGVPECFVGGAPTPPTAPAPSGFLNIAVETFG